MSDEINLDMNTITPDIEEPIKLVIAEPPSQEPPSQEPPSPEPPSPEPPSPEPPSVLPSDNDELQLQIPKEFSFVIKI